MEFTVRQASARDLDRIRAINVASLSENYPISFWKEKFDTGSIHLVAARRGLPAESRNISGYLATMPWTDNRTMIYSFAVRQEARGRGIGRALLVAFLAEFPGGIVILDVRSDNVAALALYRSVGFRSTREKPGYYGDGCSALEMEFSK